jgi:outer membrane lipoprotein-sorting protein
LEDPKNTPEKAIYYNKANTINSMMRYGKKVWFVDMKTFKKIVIQYNNEHGERLLDNLLELDAIFPKYLKYKSNKQLEIKNKEIKQLTDERSSFVSKGSIYRIKLNDKSYIGSHGTTDYEQRIKTHLSGALSSLKGDLYREAFKIGWNQTKHELVSEVDYINEKHLRQIENEYIRDEYKSGVKMMNRVTKNMTR